MIPGHPPPVSPPCSPVSPWPASTCGYPSAEARPGTGSPTRCWPAPRSSRWWRSCPGCSRPPSRTTAARQPDVAVPGRRPAHPRLGAILARPEAGPLRTAAAAAGHHHRRVLPALIAVPVIAALVSALAVRTGEPPAAAVSTGAILAALAVLALVGYLVRSLEGADRQQRDAGRRTARAPGVRGHAAAVDERGGHGAGRQLPGDRRQPALAGAHRAPRGRAGPVRRPAAAASRHRRLAGPARRRHRVPVLATMAPSRTPTAAPRAYVATYVDITDRKRAEETSASTPPSWSAATSGSARRTPGWRRRSPSRTT